MNLNTLTKVFKIFSRSTQQTIRIYWHGGESLLAGIDFFAEIVEQERKIPSKQFINIIQTNATLITKNWADFFQRNRFHIGVSVDGDEAIHNINRVYVDGRGTYADAMKGVEKLRSAGFRPGVIYTITGETISSGRRGFLSLVKQGFESIAFNVFHESGNLAVENVNNNEWLNFLKDIFNVWIEIDNDRICVREIDRILAWIENRVANACAFKGTCSNWFTIDWDGSIYPCERIGRDPKFCDISEINSFDEIFQIKKFVDWFHNVHVLPDMCKKCSVVKLCNNGCVSHRTKNDGIPHFVYCDARLSFFEYIKNQLRIYPNVKEVMYNVG